jgi:hypothetical protein
MRTDMMQRLSGGRIDGTAASAEPRARLEFHARPAGAAYFVDESGVRWRIYDCVVRRGRLERVYLESDAAVFRVFVDPDGSQVAYHRGRREPFCLSTEACGRQLRQAQLIGTSVQLETR